MWKMWTPTTSARRRPVRQSFRRPKTLHTGGSTGPRILRVTGGCSCSVRPTDQWNRGAQMTPTNSRPGGKTEVLADTMKEPAADHSPDTLWVSAAFIETLVLVGGMLWIT